MSLPSNLQNFWDEQSAIIATLYDRGEISLAQSAQNIFAKSLIIIAASFFETELRDLVIRAIDVRTKSDECVNAFCRRKGIERQFHTWFDWDKNNANAFFALFGEEMKKNYGLSVKEDALLDQAAKNFLFVGRTRNELIHQNLLTFPFEETAEQARLRIESAAVFIGLVEKLLVPVVSSD